MPATVPLTFEPVAPEARGYNAPVTADFPRRLLGNLYHALVCITGHPSLPGLSPRDGVGGHGVTGHGHTGGAAGFAGDGLPMPRNLGHLLTAPWRPPADLPGSGVVSPLGDPVADVALSPHAANPARHGLAGQWFNLLDLRIGGAYVTVAPMFRGVRISPGCHYVGLLVVYEVVTPVGAPLTAGDPVALLQLSSSVSRQVANLTGGPAADYVATAWGAPGVVYPTGSTWAVEPSGSIKGTTGLKQLLLGNVFRPTPGNYAAAQFRTGDTGIDAYAGACPVVPGVANDINVSVQGLGADAHLLVWGYTLFEIGLPAGALPTE
jgi:hypothetical protein